MQKAKAVKLVVQDIIKSPVRSDKTQQEDAEKWIREPEY